MRRLWSASGRRLARVPERDTSQGVAWLLVGCLTIASGILVSGRDTTGLARFAVALYAFVNATLHFMSDDRLREKVALRGGGLSFLLVLCLEYAYRRQRSRSF